MIGEFSEDDYLFFIRGNTPSSKNGRRWTGKFFVVSATTEKWRKLSKDDWTNQAIWFHYITSMLPKPLYVELTFIRNRKVKFDYNNISQAVMDEMKPPDLEKLYEEKASKKRRKPSEIFLGQSFWINEDDADEIKPYFGDYIYDKERSGCIIRVIPYKPILP